MKKNFIIIGGTKGLGKEIVQIISQKNHNVIYIGREKTIQDSHNLKFIEHDLEKISFDDFISIFKSIGEINGICFTHRYRKKEEKRFADEVNVMIEPIAQCMEALIQYQSNKEINYNFFTRVIITGSSYSSRVGIDQDWMYHASKAAQLSLVRYFSIRSNGKYSINLLSPATYMKDGSYDYWKEHKKFKNWRNFPTQGLLSAKEVALSIIDFLEKNSPFISGNEIMIDGGLFNLYPDQVPDILE